MSNFSVTILFAVTLTVLTLAAYLHYRRWIVGTLKKDLKENVADRVRRRIAAQVVATRAVFQEVYGTPNSKIISDFGISQTFHFSDYDKPRWRPEYREWTDGICIAEVYALPSHVELQRTPDEREKTARYLATYQKDIELNWVASFAGEIAWDYFGARALMNFSEQGNAEKLLMYIWRLDLSAWMFTRKVRAELDRKEYADMPLMSRQPSLTDASNRVESYYTKIADLIDAHRSVIESLADEIVRSVPKIDRDRSNGKRFFVSYKAPVTALRRLMETYGPRPAPTTPPTHQEAVAP